MRRAARILFHLLAAFSLILCLAACWLLWTARGPEPAFIGDATTAQIRPGVIHFEQWDATTIPRKRWNRKFAGIRMGFVDFHTHVSHEQVFHYADVPIWLWLALPLILPALWTALRVIERRRSPRHGFQVQPATNRAASQDQS